MALTNVANHLKTMATGFADKASGLANGLTGGITGLLKSASGSQAKVAAQLLKKSPFETPDSPMAKATADPLQFSHVSYPRDLESTGLGHCMIFYAMSNSYGDVEGDLKVGGRVSPQINIMDEVALTGNVVKNIRGLNGKPFTPIKTNNSVLAKKVTHKTATAAISIYMPPGVKVQYSMSYDVLPSDTSGTIARALGEAGSAATTADGIKEILRGGAGALSSYGKKLIDGIGDSLEIGRPMALISKSVGVAFNPHEEMFFEKPEFRSFSYTFDFWPKSEAEMKDVNKIIFLVLFAIFERQVKAGNTISPEMIKQIGKYY